MISGTFHRLVYRKTVSIHRTAFINSTVYLTPETYVSKLSYRNFQNVNGFSQPYVEEKCSHQVEAKMSITSTSVSTSLATPVMTTTMWQTTLASFPRRKPTSHKRHQERRKHDHHHRRRRDLWRPASKVAQTVGLKIQKIA